MSVPPRSPVSVRIQQDDFDVGAEIAALTAGRLDCGAVVSFSGICRADDEAGASGARVEALTLEHYPGMAEEEILRHVEKAQGRWPLQGVTVIHRVGRIRAGENIVLVITASAHRQAAFEAAEFVMDYLKTSAPIWKKAERQGGADWVMAHERDDQAAARWDES